MGGLSREARPVALATVTAVAAGDSLHLALHLFGVPLPHHLIHVLFVGGAAIVFWSWVWLKVRRDGAPTFSWRL